MKKLPQILTAILFISATLTAQGQPSKQQINSKPTLHLAKFSVHDYTTKAPIEHAAVKDQQGNELGLTNSKGDLNLNLPSSSSDFYTISADGFNPMNIRLIQAEKKTGKYEIYLPSMELGYNKALMPENEFSGTEPAEDLVKVYVKQDMETYEKKTTQGGEISFSVQVSASSNPISEQSAKKDWQEMGRVYIQKENGMYKVRIGPFQSQLEAKQVLLNVKSKGRKDAFIVVQQGGDYDAPMVETSKEEMSPAPTENIIPVEEAEGEYKVRIASYLQPGGFKSNGIEQLGKLESYRKGEWTIMMVGGFKTMLAAQQAKKIVISKGFNDAAIVIERDGILETIEEN